MRAACIAKVLALGLHLFQQVCRALKIAEGCVVPAEEDGKGDALLGGRSRVANERLPYLQRFRLVAVTPQLLPQGKEIRRELVDYDF